MAGITCICQALPPIALGHARETQAVRVVHPIAPVAHHVLVLVVL